MIEGQFRIRFDLGNEAFQDGSLRAEVYRILRNIAVRVRDGEDGGKVMDSNGNSVGTWALEAEGGEEDE